MSGWRCISAFTLLLLGGTVSAAPTESPPVSSAHGIIITSQSLRFKSQDNTAFFEGQVEMRKPGFLMNADHMVVHFDNTPSSPGGAPSSPTASADASMPAFGNRTVSWIEAMGNVVMQQGAKTARSQKAVYYQRDDKLILTGNPEVWEDGYRVTGVKMTMFLREERNFVEGSRVVITPESSSAGARAPGSGAPTPQPHGR